MHHLDVKRHLLDDDVDAISELLKLTEEHDGHAAMGDHQWLDLVQGGRRGFAALVAWEPGHDHPVGYAQVSRGDDVGDAGVAEGSHVSGSWALELVIAPHHRHEGSEIGTDLLRSAMAIVGEEGGGHVHLWIPKPTDLHDELAAATGLRRGRDLYQMRRRLPVEESFSLVTRPFRPGQDEDAWLDVNNRAFAWHPEQGGWGRELLVAREAEAWFDPSGFLLHEEDGRLVGFCWTKVHDDHDPPLGEIYVVAVDPDHGGRGLGRALTLAGLAHLAGLGLGIGMLYVDASNKPALRLYEDLGFTVDHVDRAYTADVVASLPGE